MTERYGWNGNYMVVNRIIPDGMDSQPPYTYNGDLEPLKTGAEAIDAKLKEPAA